MRASYEKIPLPADESFACRPFALPAFDAPWHFHPEIELTLIEASSGTRFVGDHIAPFEAGDLVLLGPNLPHFWHNPAPATGSSPDPTAARSVVLQFHADILAPLLARLPELAPIRRLLERAERGLWVHGEALATASAALRRLVEARGAARISGLLETLAILAAAPPAELEPLASLGYHADLNDVASERIERVHDYIMTHFTDSEGLDLETAARLAHLSPAAFCRYFKRHTGKTFLTMVSEVRIGHACRLLVDTDQPITVVAHASGYGSLASFNRQFRARTGRSPGGYRRAHLLAAHNQVHLAGNDQADREEGD